MLRLAAISAGDPRSRAGALKLFSFDFLIRNLLMA
jgi:hypothetical protein